MTLPVKIFLGVLLLVAEMSWADDGIRLKDLGRFNGWRENHLIGIGIATGLAGTGDSPRSRATRQSLSNLMSNFDLTVPSDQINSRNVAAVSVVASLPPVARPGDRVDVVVTSIGDARSLAGGSLLLTSLKGPDGHVYALAQGAISIGGYRYDQNGNLAQKNHPTVGVISNGAQIESEIQATQNVAERDMPTPLEFVLSRPDYTTAQRVAKAIAARFGRDVASVRDSGAIQISVPDAYRHDLAGFMAALEAIEAKPDALARVVVNERTGTIVAGGNVRISPVTIAHGNLNLSIVTDYAVSQPFLLNRPGAGIRTEVVPNTRIKVEEEPGGILDLPGQSTVAELARLLHGMKAHTRDIIAILQGIKAAGALHADLIIQ